MHVERQQKLKPPSLTAIKEAAADYKHQCEFCDRKFKTARGLKIHTKSCNHQHGLTDKEFPIDKLNAVFGTPQFRWFKVQWEGYPGQDSWMPERSLKKQGCADSIKDFWRSSNKCPSTDFIPDPEDTWRCWCCGKGYKTASSLKAHITRLHPPTQWHGSTAAKDARKKLHEEAQNRKEHVVCNGVELSNCWLFKYLGSLFRADGDQKTDIKTRVAIALVTSGKMRSIWAAKHVPLSLKLRIYKTGVCSKLTYGSEAWILDAKAVKTLNGANSRMLARFTGKSIRDEACAATRTFDVVKSIRKRRLKWVGHILRMDAERLVQKALRHLHG